MNRDWLYKTLLRASLDRPLILHLDILGIIGLGNTVRDCLMMFESILVDVAKKGGTILVPCFSYSYTKGEMYNPQLTSSQVGHVSEFLRQSGKARRTLDGLFSYLVFGPNVDPRHFEVTDFASMGANGLMAELYDKNAHVGAIGNVLHEMTEAHHLEWREEVSYRFDKTFTGQIDINSEIYDQTIVFFCRDLDLGRGADFRRLILYMRDKGIVESHLSNDQRMLVEYVPYQLVHRSVKELLHEDSWSLTKRIDND